MNNKQNMSQWRSGKTQVQYFQPAVTGYVCHAKRVIQLYMREPTRRYNAIFSAGKPESNIYPNQPSSTPTFLSGWACYFIQTVHGYAVGFILLSPPFCTASLRRLLPQAPDWISCSTRLLLSSWLKLLTFRSPLTLFLQVFTLTNLSPWLCLKHRHCIPIGDSLDDSQDQPLAHTVHKRTRIHT